MKRSLPHSVELRAFLINQSPRTGNGKFIEAIDKHIEKFDTFCDKWRDTTYSVTGPPEDEGLIKAAFEKVFDRSDFTTSFESIVQTIDGSPTRQVELYNLASGESLSKALIANRKHSSAIDRANFRRGNRGLDDVINTNLGTRRLQQALDNSFGASFGRLIKHDIVQLWICYFSYVLLGDLKDAESFDGLIKLEKRNTVIGWRNNNWFLWST